MMQDTPSVVIDACVLHSVLKRNIILSLAEDGFFMPRWSPKALAEFETSLITRLGASKAKQQRQRIQNAFQYATVLRDGEIENSLKLPDKNDRHVLAAAITAQAGLIVTDNLKDFPQEALNPYKIKSVNADNFIASLIFFDSHKALNVLYSMLGRFERPPTDMDTLILRMRKENMTKTPNLLMDILPK